MAKETTLAIVKPDAVASKLVGEILSRIEAAGLEIAALRMERLSHARARNFYYVHRGKPFFESLVEFMTSGPVVLLALRGENAVARWRQLMGPTDPRKAPKGTIRGDLGTSIEKNAVHGSDSVENASTEVHFFFGGADLFEIDPEEVWRSGS
ncbi:MAG TPA: nucleoside-diphosphate kinase [Planctomycetes bacterium]|nr:nucleoside-diphosphate kinase [Planctomycetota bacterium]